MEPNLSDLHIEEQRGMWWKLKPLDTVGRAVKYCLRILHPPARLPLSSLPLSLSLFLSGPFWTPSTRRRSSLRDENQKLNVAAFISRWRLQPLLFSTFLLPLASRALPPLRGRLLQPSFPDRTVRTGCVSACTARFCFCQALWHFYPVKREPLYVSYLRVSFGWKYNASYGHLLCVCLA